MSDKTNIGYCDTTVNPTSGCDGCELFKPGSTDNPTCYAKGIHENRLAKSYPKMYAEKFNEVRMIPGRILKVAKASDMAGKTREGKPWLDGMRRVIFVGDMTDIFSKAVTFEYLRDEVFAPMVGDSPGFRHWWIVLTKRPARMAEFSRWLLDEGANMEICSWPHNCIAMTSITSQRTADARIPELLNVEAECLGLSIEPMKEPITFLKWLADGRGKLRWAIPGGESGPNRIDCGAVAIRNTAMQFRDAGVPVFVKQDSAPSDGQRGRLDWDTWSLKQMPERWRV